jgi:hypothetical protein
MSTMITEVYDAFKAAGVDDEKARKAAEAVASYENKFHDMKAEFQELKASQNLLKWMVGSNIVLTIGILGKLLK